MSGPLSKLDDLKAIAPQYITWYGMTCLGLVPAEAFGLRTLMDLQQGLLQLGLMGYWSLIMLLGTGFAALGLGPWMIRAMNSLLLQGILPRPLSTILRLNNLYIVLTATAFTALMALLVNGGMKA